MNKQPTILILGGGPAGLSASIHLAKEGIPHILIEKGSYPRDKICGDALSGKVIAELKRLDIGMPGLLWQDEDRFLGSFGIRFFAPNGKLLDIPFKNDLDSLTTPPGFLSKRIRFDDWLFQRLDRKIVDVMEFSGKESVSWSRLKGMENGK
jgi:flavin-dependent dehydrogenase